MSGRGRVSGWVIGIGAIVVLSLASLVLGELNQDEGWYLNASRLIASGRVAYRDFALTQGPVMPLVYVVSVPLVHVMGVAGGRLFTVLLSWLCLAGTGLLAARLVPRGVRGRAALLAVWLAGVCVYQAYFTAIVKTYALTGLFLVGGFLVLPGRGEGWRFWVKAALAGALHALAAGTRFSAAFVLPVVFAGFVIEGLGRGVERGRSWWLRPCWSLAMGYAAGGALALALVFLPYLVVAPQGLWFALVEYHAGRETGGALSLVAYKGGFVLRLLRAYSAAAVVGAVAVGYLLSSGAGRVWALARWKGSWGGWRDPLGLVFWSTVAVTAIHFMAPFPYDDYQVIIYPLTAAWLSAAVVRITAWATKAGGAKGVGVWVSGSVMAVTLLLAVSSGMIQGWLVAGRDLIWWPLRTEAPLTRLQRVARMVREEVEPGGMLLTQDTYLAVESGLQVPAGMEMGPFCYFPEWEGARADACRVLNRDAMLRVIMSGEAAVAAFSEYGLAIRSPEVAPVEAEEREMLWQALLMQYEPWETISDFGQGDTTLHLLKRRAGVRGGDQ